RARRPTTRRDHQRWGRACTTGESFHTVTPARLPLWKAYSLALRLRPGAARGGEVVAAINGEADGQHDRTTADQRGSERSLPVWLRDAARRAVPGLWLMYLGGLRRPAWVDASSHADPPDCWTDRLRGVHLRPGCWLCSPGGPEAATSVRSVGADQPARTVDPGIEQRQTGFLQPIQ